MYSCGRSADKDNRCGGSKQKLHSGRRKCEMLHTQALKARILSSIYLAPFGCIPQAFPDQDNPDSVRPGHRQFVSRYRLRRSPPGDIAMMVCAQGEV
jgi:hypothetical protein